VLLRILAVMAIWALSTAAWLGLGASVSTRSAEQSTDLGGDVRGLYGGGVIQAEPTLVAVQTLTETELVPLSTGAYEKKVVTREVERPVPLEASDVAVVLSLDQRRKGLLWFATFRSDLEARYRVGGDARGQMVRFRFPLPRGAAAYDGIRVDVDGAPVEAPIVEGTLLVELELPQAGATIGVRYATRGLDEWRYDLGGDVSRVRDFRLEVRTDFTGFDFPAGTLSPTSRLPAGSGETLTWLSSDLVTRLDLGLTLPRNLNPGPFAARLAFFAPVGLLFFFFALFLLAEAKGVALHPVHYAFLAAGAFSFHLLLAYTADHLPLALAFCTSAAVSVGLVVSYLARAVSPAFALRAAGPAHFVYLVLFSAAFFAEGFTGLTVTLGAVSSLFWAMQLTARVRWAERFAA
jgi:hypothetical protein